MNFSMFLPQAPEVDAYDANGQQLDDINSVVEYIRVALDYDHIADDEDDDSGENFHLVKDTDYFYQQQITTIEKPTIIPQHLPGYAEYSVNKAASVNFDIVAPPPET